MGLFENIFSTLLLKVKACLLRALVSRVKRRNELLASLGLSSH